MNRLEPYYICCRFAKITWTVIVKLQRVLKQEVNENNEVEVQSPDWLNEKKRKLGGGLEEVLIRH